MAHSWPTSPHYAEAKPHYAPLLDRLDYTYKDSRIAESRFGSGIALYFWFFRFLIQVTLVVWYVPRATPALPPPGPYATLAPPRLASRILKY